MIELTEKQKDLFDLIWALPPNFDEIEAFINSEEYSEEDISRIGTYYVDNCYGEAIDDYQENEYTTIEPHAPYIFDTIKLLLCYGLDPNSVFDGKNIMNELQYIVTEYVAADTLRLLLEHGGKYNLLIDNEILFDELDFDIIFGAVEQTNRRRYGSLVHCWLVMLGFGAKLVDGKNPVTLFPNDDGYETGIDISDLKNHENYTYALTHVPGNGEKWSLHIIDKKTMWEVARL